MADTIAQQPNTLLDISTLLKNLGPMLLGSGTTTKSETTTPGAATTVNAGDTGSLQQLLATLLPQITGTDSTNDVVNNILNQAAVAFAPQRSNENGSGMYNTSALSAMASQAQGLAAGQASQAVLQHQTAAAQLATTAAGDISRVNSTSTRTAAPSTTTGTSVTPANSTLQGLTGALGVGTGALSLYKNKDVITKLLGLDKTGTQPTQQALDEASQTGAQQAYGPGDASGFNGTSGFNDGSIAQAGPVDPSPVAGQSLQVGDTSGVGGNFQTAGFNSNIFDSAPDAGISDGGIADAGVFTPPEPTAAAPDVPSFDPANTLISNGDGTYVNGLGESVDLTPNLESGYSPSGFSNKASDILIEEGQQGNEGIVGPTDQLQTAFQNYFGGDTSAFDGLSSDALNAEGFDASSAVDGDFASSLGFDAGTDIGADAAGEAGIEGAADIGVGLAADTTAEATGVLATAGAESAAEGAAAAAAFWIICTHLTQKGKMDKRDWQTGARFFLRYPQWGKEGYWFWAIPALRFMKAQPDHWFTELVTILFRSRMDHIANRKCVSSFFSFWLVEIFSAACGVVVLGKKFATLGIRRIFAW